MITAHAQHSAKKGNSQVNWSQIDQAYLIQIDQDFDYAGFTPNTAASPAEQTNQIQMRHKDNCCIIKNEQGTVWSD